MMLQETVVIEGEASLISQIDGDPSLLSEVDGDPNVFIAEGGGIVPSGTIEITENGVYNVTEYASADVDVQGGITPTGTKQISIASNGTVTEDVTDYANAEINVNVPASAVDTGTKSISTNGTHDVVGYANASVNVPNSYSQSDEGKVVSNGALVAQSSQTITENGTYDTTLKDEVVVNVSGGGISVDDIATGVEPSGDITITASSIVGFAFRNNTGITGVTGNSLTIIKGSAFQSCTNMTSASFPNATQIGDDAFNGCSKLVSIDVRKLVNFFTKRGFSGCSKLTTFVGGLTKLTTMSDQCFYNTMVPVFVFPAITSGTGLNCFGGNTALTTCDFGVGLFSIGAAAFSGASSFNTLIIRKASVASLSNINAFTNTCFASGKTGGTLYVPSALISSYQSASNWSTILGYSTNSIQAIEGSQYENYYADGTPISS